VPAVKALVLWVCIGWVHGAFAADTPTDKQADARADTRTSGNVYLSAQLQALQKDSYGNPITLWIDRGNTLWQSQCIGCHAGIETLKHSAPQFPRLVPDGKSLRNLEDQIAICQLRSSSTAKPLSAVNANANATSTTASVDNLIKTTSSLANDHDDVLALSAALHQAAQGERIRVAASSGQDALWQARLQSGQQLYQTRMGRINLACMHCHDQKVGAQMRADVISQGHTTGFPIYRMTWQTLGSVERRLRACYSGVQAPLPAPGSADLRDLELFMKVRANGMVLDGPSIRR
jgi:L-cysteine S-thiosulfotransferase